MRSFSRFFARPTVNFMECKKPLWHRHFFVHALESSRVSCQADDATQRVEAERIEGSVKHFSTGENFCEKFPCDRLIAAISALTRPNQRLVIRCRRTGDGRQTTDNRGPTRVIFRVICARSPVLVTRVRACA